MTNWREWWRIFGQALLYRRDYIGHDKPNGDPYTEEDRYQAYVERMKAEGLIKGDE